MEFIFFLKAGPLGPDGFFDLSRENLFGPAKLRPPVVESLGPPLDGGLLVSETAQFVVMPEIRIDGEFQTEIIALIPKRSFSLS